MHAHVHYTPVVRKTPICFAWPSSKQGVTPIRETEPGRPKARGGGSPVRLRGVQKGSRIFLRARSKVTIFARFYKVFCKKWSKKGPRNHKMIEKRKVFEVF